MAKKTDVEAVVNEAAKKNQARSNAEKELRDHHPDEWAQLMTTHHQRLGVTWNPRLTDEQKAAKQVETLFENYPEVRDQFVTSVLAKSAHEDGEA
jgi:hypothetical protein